MLGGGVYITQNKTLRGSYINFVNRTTNSGVLGQRGVVAIALELGYKPGEVIELTKNSFHRESGQIIGKDSDSKEVAMLREIFLHSNTVYIYDIGGETELTVTDALNALEPYEFNVVCAYTNDATDIKAYVDKVIEWRDTIGKKCQVVVYNDPNSTKHEGVINVVSTIEAVDGETTDAHALVAWVAGAEAGCAVNKSCTNMLYDGEHTIVVNKTQGELEDCITNGQIVFHRVYGDIRLLEDVNTLDVNTSSDKGEDFRYNQTIRVLDLIANDISKLFNTKYVGNIPNNASGRTSLWADIVAHHRELETIEAIEKFDSSLLTVEQGATKKSIVVNDVITVVNSMTQLYMTVVVQ
jgi:hypothetical protein